jgi:type VI secretion system secreted protein Hcp
MIHLIKTGGDRFRTLHLASLLGGIALGVSGAVPAQAANELFLTWPGIIGPSTVQGHVGDIELTSYSQNASNTASLGSAGTGAGAGAGKAICGEVTVTKRIDSTSPIFLGMVLSGKVTPGPVTVTFARGAQDNTFYSVSLRRVLPTSITQSDSTGPDKLTETIVFSATEFVFTYTPQLPNGSVGTPVTFRFDCTTNKIQ